MAKVAVIMSTFNGEKYIKQQVKTIFGNNKSKITLFVRDDGSKDETVTILYELKNRYDIRIFEGENIGWKRSFLKLIYNIDDDFDYYAISDQDDIWKTDKIDHAVGLLSKYNTAALYFSNMNIINTSNNTFNRLYNNTEQYDYLSNYYYLGASPFGCSLIWNREMQKLINVEKPHIAVAYDQWIHLIARVNATVVVDFSPQLNHLIHGDNVCGVSSSIMDKINKIKKIYFANDFVKPSNMIDEYFRIYGDKCDSDLMKFLGKKKRKKRVIELIKQREFKRLSLKKKIRYGVFFVFNRL